MGEMVKTPTKTNIMINNGIITNRMDTGNNRLIMIKTRWIQMMR